MSQQINLLNLDLRPQKELLNSSRMVLILAGFLVLMSSVTGYTYRHMKQVELERADWDKRLQDSRDLLTRSAQQFQPQQPSKALQGDIAMLEEKIQARDKVVSAMKTGMTEKSEGFSPLLGAFARQRLNGLWLTGISMSREDGQMRISGNALSADIIPQYITRLSGENALRGRQFSNLQVERPKLENTQTGQPTAGRENALPPYVEFKLSAGGVMEIASQNAGKPVEKAKL